MSIPTTKEQIKKAVNYRFRNVDPFEFEEFIAYLYKCKGYHAFATKPTADYGVDVIANSDNESIAIQVKRYKTTNSTGSEAIKEIYWGRNHYNCNKAIVITTSHFTKYALKSAKKSDVELWDWQRLKKEIASVKELEVEQRKHLTFGQKIDKVAFKVALVLLTLFSIIATM